MVHPSLRKVWLWGISTHCMQSPNPGSLPLRKEKHILCNNFEFLSPYIKEGERQTTTSATATQQQAEVLCLTKGNSGHPSYHQVVNLHV